MTNEKQFARNHLQGSICKEISPADFHLWTLFFRAADKHADLACLIGFSTQFMLAEQGSGMNVSHRNVFCFLAGAISATSHAACLQHDHRPSKQSGEGSI